MSNIKFLLFDCMETLIDIEGFSEPEDYANHTFNGSGIETYWAGFADFYQEYLRIRQTQTEQLRENEEYGFPTMFRLICESNSNIENNKVNKIADRLFENYWSNYIARCYVDSNIEEILSLLSEKYRLGVVSNFKTDGGIEALLKRFNIEHWFEFVITSMSIGWKKPDRRIYEAVFNETNLLPEQHLFIGDDYENDFQQPIRLGMKALFLDKKGEYPDVKNRISSLSALPHYLQSQRE